MSQTDPDYDVPCDEACQLAKEGAAASSLYRFPATRWVSKNNVTEQARKVVDEAVETLSAAFHDDPIADVAEELLDTIQAAETGLRICESLGVDVEARRVAVEGKNRDRGYYDESWRRCDGCAGDECPDGCTADQDRDEHSDEFEGEAS